MIRTDLPGMLPLLLIEAGAAFVEETRIRSGEVAETDAVPCGITKFTMGAASRVGSPVGVEQLA